MRFLHHNVCVLKSSEHMQWVKLVVFGFFHVFTFMKRTGSYTRKEKKKKRKKKIASYCQKHSLETDYTLTRTAKLRTLLLLIYLNTFVFKRKHTQCKMPYGTDDTHNSKMESSLRQSLPFPFEETAAVYQACVP